jgi:acetyl-CoA carboxylase biotin carboxylase subunit
VPVTPGSKTVLKTKEEALKTAKKIGYPVIIKASAGGGGKGMRICHNDISLINGMLTAQSEAESAFGNSSVYMEKYIEAPRHIEFQILADEAGNTIHLWERDCTIQRRHQKLIEEAPSATLDDKMRREMGDVAVKAARAVDYVGAGTIEFLVDGEDFYFMEMNTRIQVEHPVTEMITGIDLIKEQILVACGRELSVDQDDIKINGAAIECRINAEDPDNNFQPSPGKIEALSLPGGPGIRLDTHIYSGYQIPPFYDSMLAKLISYGTDREDAIIRMQRGLEEFLISPIKTTVDFHKKVLNDLNFRKGDFSTHFVEQFYPAKEKNN